MMRSLFSGVSGLKTHQTRMDVIGNNIANVNTTAFKSKNVNFADMLYQTTQPASGPNPEAGTGGINAMQIGLGVKTASINTTITQPGANQSTGNPFDLKLTGDAFFVVSDGTNTYYTKDGAFDVDDAGNLCMASTGYIVQGWGVDANNNIVQGSVGNLNVMSRSSYDPAATTSATVSGIIDKTDAYLETKTGKVMNLQVFDKLGYEYNLQFGILPKKSVVKTMRTVENTEIEYTMPPSAEFHKVDTSTLDYSYDIETYAADGKTVTSTETRYLTATKQPELLNALHDAVWQFVQAGGKLATGTTMSIKGTKATKDVTFTGSHVLGKEDSITIKIDQNFLEAYGLDTNLLDLSALRGEDIKVTFSGDTGYIESKQVPDYPLQQAVLDKISDIDDKAVEFFYVDQTKDTPAGTANANGIITYNQKANMDKITVIKQSYELEDGTAEVKYIFKYLDKTATPNAAKEIDDANKASDLYSDIMKLMGLGKDSKTKDIYVTKQYEDTAIDSPGNYEVKLLSMSSNGSELDISALANTSWDLAYYSSNGKFDYVGSSGNKAFTLALSGINEKFSDVAIDWSDTTNVFNEGKSTVTGLKDDGRMVGKLKGVSIAQDGMITANYTNGMAATIGQVCVGTFANAMGLQNSGDNLYSETPNSGDCRMVDIKASGTGYLTTGVLEMSNVDLSQEFTSMITTQRGFQANSRIITTSDGMLEELVNLKR